jgi:hypothetical protein
LESIYNKDTKDIRNAKQLTNLFYAGKGNQGRTFYDAFNSITEFASNYSRKSVSGRLNYSQFGQGAAINQRAMAVLTEMATV